MFLPITYQLRRMMFLLLGSFFIIDEGGRKRDSRLSDFGLPQRPRHAGPRNLVRLSQLRQAQP